MRIDLAVISTLLLCLGCQATPKPSGPWAVAALATPAPEWAAIDAAMEEPTAEPESHGFGHRLLYWIPNRISDVLDIVRARVRIGPGLAVGARVTELADVYVGAYTSMFIGIPGPRLRPKFNWPWGLETAVGAEVSVVDGMETDERTGPSYGPVEIGLGFQAAIIGLDLGVEPWEVVDFVVGILTFDLVGDDL